MIRRGHRYLTITVVALIAALAFIANVRADEWRDLYLEFKKEHGAGRYSRAERLAKQMLEIAETKRPDYSEAIPVSLHLLGNVYAAQKRHAAAEAAYKRALAIFEEARDPNHEEIAAVSSNLGALFLDQDRFTEADHFLKQALKILEEAHGPDHHEATFSLRCMALLAMRLGRYAEAEPLLTRALAIDENAFGRENYKFGKDLGALADLYEEMGRYCEVEPLYIRELAILEKVLGREHPGFGRRLTDLGSLYTQLGRYAEAEPLLKRSLAILEKALDPEHPHLANGYNGLGLLYKEQGRSADAEPLYARALAITKKVYGPEHPLVAIPLSNLTALYLAEGRYSDAEPFAVQMLAISEKAFGSEHPEVAHAHLVQAALRAKQGNTADAERLYQRALAIFEKVYGPEHVEVWSYVNNLAALYIDQGRYADGEPLYRRMVSLVDQPLVGAYKRFLTYRGRAFLQWKRNRRTDAVADLNKALGFADQQRGNISGGEQERATGFTAFTGAFEQMVTWQQELGNTSEAWAAAERRRSRSLVDQLNQLGVDLLASVPAAEAAVLRWRDNQAQTLVASLQKQLELVPRQTELSEAQRQARATQLEQNLAKAREAAVDVYRDLRNASPAYRLTVQRDFQPAGLATTQEWATHEQSVVLAYFLGEEAGYLFILQPGQEPRLLPLEVSEDQAPLLGTKTGPLTVDQMNLAMQLEQTSLLQLLSDPNRAGQATDRLEALWNLLIPADVQRELIGDKVRRLVVIPDGPLALLPFETLVVDGGDNPRYLVDVGPPVLYAPSATVLSNLMERPAMRGPADLKPVLTVGNPVYGSSTTTVVAQGTSILNELTARSRYSAVGGHLAPLPYSGVESTWVGDGFSKSGTPVGKLQQRDATEANVRFNVTGRRIIHLACHGLTDQKYGNFFGALALTPGPQAATNPADDGMLTLPEIYELNLKSCELAILSACQTNYGPQQKGEGVWALSRGFLVAGARRVVASNWLVDDEAAASLISYYCAGLALDEKEGRPVDYAGRLHAARKWVRSQEKWKSPYYWGTFVLVGPQ